MRLKNNGLLTIAFLLFIFLYFSSNCNAQRLPDETYSFIKETNQNGLIFGTITFPKEKMKFDSYMLQVAFMSTDNKMQRKNSNKIIINPTMFNKKHIGELDEGRTYFFAMEKPIGDYTICWLKLSTLKLMQYAPNETSVSGFSIPFTVNKGEIKYIGNININEYAIEGEQVITLKDEFERDKSAINSLPINVNFNDAVKSEMILIQKAPSLNIKE
jgi:hypothetical protein